MAKQIASLELHYLIKEFKVLEGARVDHISHPEKKILSIGLYQTGLGKKNLFIDAPNIICIKDDKSSSEKHSSYCALLRKHLMNSKLTRIEQVGFERIINLHFKSRSSSDEFVLVIELFSKGNLIFCDSGMKILGIVETQSWKDRTLRGGIVYSAPPQKIDASILTATELKTFFQNKPDEIVKFLAKELGLGGRYAEEVCLIARIDKKKNVLSEDDFVNVSNAIKKILNKNLHPTVTVSCSDNTHGLNDDKSEAENSDSMPSEESNSEKVIDYSPFELESERFEEVKDKQKISPLQRVFKKEFSSLNNAINYYFSRYKPSKRDAALKKFEGKIEALTRIMDEQIERRNILLAELEENKEKGEHIYNHYSKVSEILGAISKARESMSWNEIMDKMKKSSTIRSVNEKEKKGVFRL